jgi:hypothetical protein
MADAEGPMQVPAPEGTVEVEVETEPAPDGTVEAATTTEHVEKEEAVSAASVNASVTVSGEANTSTTDTATAMDTTGVTTTVDTTTTALDTTTTTTPILPEGPVQMVEGLNSNEAQMQMLDHGEIEGGLALTKEEAEYRDAAIGVDISGSAQLEAQPPAEGEEPSTDGAIQIWGPADPDVLSVSRIVSYRLVVSILCTLLLHADLTPNRIVSSSLSCVLYCCMWTLDLTPASC